MKKALLPIIIIFLLQACSSQEIKFHQQQDINLKKSGEGAHNSYSTGVLPKNAEWKFSDVVLDSQSEAGSAYVRVIFYDDDVRDYSAKLIIEDEACDGFYEVSFEYRSSNSVYINHYFATGLKWGEVFDLLFTINGKALTVGLLGNEKQIKSVNVSRNIKRARLYVYSGDFKSAKVSNQYIKQ